MATTWATRNFHRGDRVYLKKAKVYGTVAYVDMDLIYIERDDGKRGHSGAYWCLRAYAADLLPKPESRIKQVANNLA